MQSEGGGGSENSLLLAMKALASMHILLFFVSVVVMGGGAGLVFSFLYWHLQDIGGSPVLFGILSVVNHASEIITYFYVFKLINKVSFFFAFRPKIIFRGLFAKMTIVKNKSNSSVR